jgi:hypothetical protein
MSRKRFAVAWGLCLVAALALVLLAGCAARKGAPGAPGAPAAGAAAKLEYHFPPGKPVTYTSTEDMTQTMQVMNQYMNTESKKSLTFTITPGEVKNGKQALSIRVDSLSLSLTTPQGDFTADASQTVGKSFDMALTAVGEELDITGAELVQYSMGPAGQRDVKSDFQSIFPNLAGKPVKIGDTWTVSDTTDVDEGGMKLTIITDNVNTFAGYEDVDGIQCARITTTSKGTVKGGGEQQGMKVTIDSTLDGNDIWFFAADRGLLAKITGDVAMAGTVQVGGAQGMSIPMKQQMKTGLVLVK